MGIGLFLTPATAGPADDTAVIRRTLDQIHLADAARFDAVWLSEHHFSGASAFADPLLLAAYLAATVRMPTIGLAVAVLPLHHPVRFATQIALLDVLSAGRLVVGIGLGYDREAYQAYGVDFETRGARADDFLDVVKRIWAAEGPTRIAGRFHEVDLPGRLIPQTLQRPHPLLARATKRLETIEQCGRDGICVLLLPFGIDILKAHVWPTFLRGLAESNLDAAGRRRVLACSGISKHVYVRARDEDPAVGQGYAARFRAHFPARPAPGAAAPLAARVLRDVDDHFFAVGDADEVAAALAPYLTEVGGGQLLLNFGWGALPPSAVTASLEHFAADVLPRLPRASAAQATAAPAT